MKATADNARISFLDFIYTSARRRAVRRFKGQKQREIKILHSGGNRLPLLSKGEMKL